MTISIEAFQERIGFKRRKEPSLAEQAPDLNNPYPDEEELDFPPNVIPSENLFVFPDYHEIAEPLDEKTRKIFKDHYAEFHTTFTFQLRNELVKQLFQSFNDEDHPEGSIDLTQLSTVIKEQILSEKDYHYERAQYLEHTAIPAARLRPVFKAEYSGNPSAYLEKDIPYLEDREEAHLAMDAYLDEFTPKSQEALIDLTEQLSRQFLPEARAEAVKILTEQIAAQEAQKQAVEQQIAKLAARKALLTGETVRSTDVPPAGTWTEDPVVDELTRRAKALAA